MEHLLLHKYISKWLTESLLFPYPYFTGSPQRQKIVIYKLLNTIVLHHVCIKFIFVCIVMNGLTKHIQDEVSGPILFADDIV